MGSERQSAFYHETKQSYFGLELHGLLLCKKSFGHNRMTGLHGRDRAAEEESIHIIFPCTCR